MIATFGLETLRELYSHMEWADARVWTAVLGCEEARRDTVVREKLVHIHLVQVVYLKTWTHQPWSLPSTEETRDADAVWRWARPYYDRVSRFLAAATDDALVKPLPAAFARQIEESLGAGQICPTISDSAFQVTSHSTHHRGQLNTRLRELGAEPPQWDYIAWVWFGRPPASWPRD